MASPADVIRLYFVHAGIGIASGTVPTANQWPVYTGDLPADYDNALAIQDTGGFVERRVQKTGESFVHATVIINIRSVPYNKGTEKGRQIKALLEKLGLPAPVGYGKPVVAVEGQNWTIEAAHLTVPLVKIGVEEKNRRQLFTMNYKLTLVQPPVDLSSLTP